MFEADGRSFTTPEVHAPSGHISVVGNKLIFAVNKVLSTREWLPLSGNSVPFSLIPGNIIALIKGDLSVEEAVDLISERTEKFVIQEILREERYSLRDECKQPWSVQTRRPFRGVIDKVEITFRMMLELAERVVNDLGSALKVSKRGRPILYDRIKLLAAILVKGMRSFVDLSTELSNVQYDMTSDGSERYPSSSELHNIFKQIPVKWMEEALQRLDDLSKEEFSKFKENLDTFVIEGSALSGEILIERDVLTKIRLIRDYFQYQALARIATNTIRSIKKHSNKIGDIIRSLPAGSIVLADPEYDVEANHQVAEESTIELQVKQRKGNARKSRRKAARSRFERKKYSRRKLGERPFGNIESRRSKCYYKLPESKLKGAIIIIIIGCTHNIIAYFKNKAWCSRFTKL